MEVAARIGWLARGALYLLLAVLAARIPDTANGERVDKQGAFAELAGSPFGGWLLGAVAVGLVGFAAFRLWAAARGTDEKPNRRLGWVGSAVVYAVLAVLAFGVLRGAGDSGGGGSDEKALTTRILTWPGGQLIVGAVALVVLGVAANYVRKGIKERFLRDIDEGAVPDRLHEPVRVLGVVGWLGRALVWALVGFFLLRAAIQHDPNEPVGLDESLHALMGQGWGVALLWLAVAGMLSFALLCAATAAWPDPEPDS
jgi:hypothetical protein